MTSRRSPTLTPTSPSSPLTHVVEDEDQAHRGIAAIRAWRSKVPRVAYTVHDVKATTTGHDAAVDIAGDFPGSPVSLRFHFQFAADGRITALTIRP